MGFKFHKEGQLTMSLQISASYKQHGRRSEETGEH